MSDIGVVIAAAIRDEVARQITEIRAELTLGGNLPAPGGSLLSVHEAAEYLGVKPRTLYEWRRLRKGPAATKVGRLVKFRLGDLNEWVRADH